MLYEIKDGIIQFKLSKKLYNMDDIMAAQHSISDRCTMILDEDNKYYLINLTSTESPDSIHQLFLYKLSDFVIRSNLLKENKHIRDLIVENAFKPIENLEEKLHE
jgi:His-Xaa-Ser system protein HxsD